jgi:hypothetical protein
MSDTPVTATPILRKGIYRHFKGKLYEVTDLARHSETQEWYVVYRALYGDYGLFVRPFAMFVEQVEREGKTFARFEFVRDE